jgi:hypothetical protein
MDERLSPQTAGDGCPFHPRTTLDEGGPSITIHTTEEPMSTTTNQIPFHQRHDEELLSLAEVAEILKSPENTLRWWRQIGKGPAFFKIGRRLVTTVGDVRQFMREQRLAAQPLIDASRRH